MLPIELQSNREMARMIAGRVKALRLERAWTQRELAERAELAVETFRLFERTGRISLARLLRLAMVLDALDGIDQLFRPTSVRSLADLEALDVQPTRKRGKRRASKA